MPNEVQSIEQLSRQVGEIFFGTLFFLVGLIAAGIALIRRGRGVRILIWLALWSGLYGARMLITSPAIRPHFPQPLQIIFPYIDVTITYLILVFALLVWLELTLDKARFLIQIMIVIASAIGLAGIGWFIVSGSPDTLMIYNNLVAVCTLLVLVVVVTVRKLSDKFLVLPNRGILAVGTLMFAAEALYTNLSLLFDYRTLPILDRIGFAAWLFSLAYVAAQMIFTNERRLISIDSELETARQIQSSILPLAVPKIDNLRIAAAYHPMTAVAGDFYDFIFIDSHHVGFFVADVSGHGVPAALIASMIKIAIQSVVVSADNPQEVLRRLSNIIGNQLHGQFLSAAYLYIDTEKYQARYSAAGHPPLLYWNYTEQQVRFVESNGMLIGFLEGTDYPVLEFTFRKGDRLILYTDGLTEPENAGDEAFGDHRLSEVIHSAQKSSAEELSVKLLDELRLWQQSPKEQQDDITWIIIDVL